MDAYWKRSALCLTPLLVLAISGCGTRTAFRTAMAPIRSMGDAAGLTRHDYRERTYMEARHYGPDHVHFERVEIDER